MMPMAILKLFKIKMIGMIKAIGDRPDRDHDREVIRDLDLAAILTVVQVDLDRVLDLGRDRDHDRDQILGRENDHDLILQTFRSGVDLPHF